MLGVEKMNKQIVSYYSIDCIEKYAHQEILNKSKK